MKLLASGSGGWRRMVGSYSLSVLYLLLAGSAAEAQRLLRLVPGVGSASSVGDGGSTMGPVPVAVDVDLALLRSAPFRLEAPTPEGGVLSAQRSVFEDRGNGDLMWSGGPPGAGYDTVVLTVEGGRFVGRFGSAGGAAYHIHAERDGRGGMAALGAPAIEDWCGADTGAEGEHEDHAHAHGAAASAANAARAEPPEAVSNPQSHDRLDILVTYSASAARNWADRGGPEAAIRHAGDYMKMVFRNNRLGVEPHIVHITPLPAALEYPGRERGWWRDFPWGIRLEDWDGDLVQLRHEHRADLVHVFTGEIPLVLNACGSHPTLTKGYSAARFSPLASGWTSNHGVCGDYAAIFVHEVGHGLGAHHEPAWTKWSPEERIRPYAAGHVNRDVVPNIGTAMAYGGQTQPFFSTTRFRSYGATVGVAGAQDNERTLQETVHIGVRFSDYLPSLDGLPPRPRGLRVRYDGGSANLTWQDNGLGTDGYELEYERPIFGVLRGSLESVCCDTVVLELEGRTQASIPLQSTAAGTHYYFQLRARRGDKVSLPSSTVRLIVPGEPAVAAPSDVSVEVDPELDSVFVRWTDNSDDEIGFDLQRMRNGEPIEGDTLPPDSEEGGFYRYAAGHSGFVSGGKEAGVDYGARVVAYNALGQASTSEEVPFRWEHPLATPPVSDLALFRTGPTTVRARWSPDPGVRSYWVRASVGPVAFQRSWERPRTGPVETAWLDFEGLARGGHYVFRAFGTIHDRSLAISMPSKVELTLGERGPGPQAPSALSGTVVREREGVRRDTRLSWEDNSADELGFVVQSGDEGIWRTVGVLPANTQSFLVERMNRIDDLRVFAYNEHGYSLSSPRVDAALALDLVATAGDALVGLTWGVKDFSDYDGLQTPTGVQVRWRATADLPFRGPGDSWLDLPAGARGYAVTGLRNGREYTFEARPVTSVGVGVSWAATATPRSGLPAPPVEACRADQETLCLQGGRFEVTGTWWDKYVIDSGPALVVREGTEDSGLFRFFDPLNWEILIKVLNGCDDNGHMWVLGASTTDQGYRIEVVDRVRGESRTYENEPGKPAPAIVDTKAFSCEGHGGVVEQSGQ